MANLLPGSQNDTFNQQRVADSILSVCTPKKGGLSAQDQDEIKGIVQTAFQSLVGEIQKRDLLITKLSDLNKSLIQKIEQITQEHESLKKKLDSEKSEMGILTSSIEDLKAKNLVSEARYKELLQATETLKKEASDLQGRSKDLKTEYDKLNGENATLNAKSKDLETQTSKLTDNTIKLDSENKTLLAESNKLKNDYSQLEAKYGKLEKETTSWSVRYGQLNENYAAMQKVVDEALKKKEESPVTMVVDFCERYGNYFSPFEWPGIFFDKIGL